MAFIDVQHVSKHYAAHTALDDVSLSVQAGRVFGLLGPNGAGKTSLIRIINRITAPDSGTILFDGHPLKADDVARIGYLPEERGLYRKMKVGDQAIYLSRLKGLSKAEAKKRLEQWFEKFDIMPWWNKKVEELSKGMQQKVQFICTVLHEPDLLIFDEPFSGFDPVNAELLKSEILQLRDQGRTIIFSTHNMQSVEEVCDDIALINRSRLVLSGTVEEIRARYASPYVELRVDRALSQEELEYIDPISSRLHQGQMVLKLMRREGESNRALINRLPEYINILEFHQEIPSMHEIFLNTVQNHD
ncbi:MULTISPECIES: ABC transporter ATP-binding protein [unclassified Porphyromonas]|uniref:ABC transporter ATP-binding protein n=1 Tax=unclassified Porphyromonas TaxID=2645799 RepID=UPI00052E102E|nr:MULTISPECIES: ABC transporter ATP-binding protein [unclassified Porphyromonas]KGN86456.1 ABC transporter ATP-binding protein [Porphyromonas sp. COT-290 OH860]KGO01575.1 ABC transporter ATP-binding protein [Porphyromonas sp. COT-290 OH3588]